MSGTRALKCETLGAILQVIVCSLVLLALMLTLCLLSCSCLCTVCSLVSVALLVVFSNWLGQAILLCFSLGSTHMFTRFTHFQPWWYNSLTLWAYIARRHDQQQLTNTRRLLTKWPRVEYFTFTAHVHLCARAYVAE